MKNQNIIILTKNLSISTIKYGYHNINIMISNKRPSIADIFSKKNYFLIRKDIKKDLGALLHLINICRKRWSVTSELKRLIFSKERTIYKLIMQSPEINAIYGSQFNSDLLNKTSFHTIRLIDKNKFNLYLYILYIISKIKLFQDLNTKSIICMNTTKLTFIKMLINLYPKSAIYVRFIDCFDSGYINLSGLKKLQDFASNKPNIHIESYSLYDAINHQIKYIPNTINVDKIINQNNPQYKFNENKAFFLGVVNKERFNALVQLANILFSAKVKINFYFVLNNLSSSQINSIKQININFKYDAIKVIQYISYIEYIKLLNDNNNIIVDFYRFSTNEGYSFRIPEGIIFNKKIITNREIIQKESFYTPKNILFVKEDSNKNIIIDNRELEQFLQNFNATYSKRDLDLFNFNTYLASHGIE